MTANSDHEELERRLEQARLAGGVTDPVTLERITRLIRDLEEQLE
jgi:hypothetical protein